MLALEYVQQFDQFSRYAPDMILIERRKVQRFLSGLRPGPAGLVNTGRDSPESYADAIGRAIHQEAWMKKKKKVIQNADEGSNEMMQVS